MASSQSDRHVSISEMDLRGFEMVKIGSVTSISLLSMKVISGMLIRLGVVKFYCIKNKSQKLKLKFHRLA